MIPGVQTFHPRESWVDPRYPITGPADNPANNDMVVIHYTAADNLIDGDPGEHASNLPAYMRSMQRSYVTNRGYSLGYLFAVDWLGGVWQIRGWDIQSAANKGHNDHTWPVLVLVDGDDEATPEAAASIRAIVAEAQRRAGRPQKISGHRDIGSTTCPGAGLYRQVKDGTFVPTTTPTTPTTPPPPVGYERIAVATNFEFASATRWDTRGFGGAGLQPGEYVCKLDGSPGKIGATVNLTIVSGGAAGFASAWKEGQRRDTSKVNYGATGAIANEVSVPLAADGSFRIYISATAHIIVDLVGYWT